MGRWSSYTSTVSWDVLFLGIVLLAVAAGGAWIRGRRLRRILGEPPPPRPGAVDAETAEALRRESFGRHAPWFDGEAVAERVHGAVREAFASGEFDGLEVADGARRTWEARRRWAPKAAEVGRPAVVSSYADPNWVSVDLVTVTRLTEGERPMEWEDRWRLRTRNQPEPAWELVSVDDVYRGPVRKG